ncbi:MAG: ABC transporter ATP-binding protein [Bdellovibrionota bacterium]
MRYQEIDPKSQKNSKHGELLLDVKGLRTGFSNEFGSVYAVDDVSFSVRSGKILGIVGESGCGKSVTSLSIMRLLPKPMGFIDAGEVLYKGIDLLKLPAEKMHEIRGHRIAMIFQEPMTALNPVHKVGRQIFETFRLHFPKMTKQEIYRETVELLAKVGIPAPEQRYHEFPHQLSGGMRQRIMIAIALACRPDILIADEPTTALDVTIQAQILHLLREIQQEMGMAIVFITHDLGVIAQLCDEVVVMYAGKIVEKGSVRQLFDNPLHPYTKGLLASNPALTSKRKMPLHTITGMVPSLMNLPAGCRFYNRCRFATDLCQSQPLEEETDSGQMVACFHWREKISK